MQNVFTGSPHKTDTRNKAHIISETLVLAGWTEQFTVTSVGFTLLEATQAAKLRTVTV